MRVLVLGAGGQIGAPVLAECHRRDYPVQATWYCRPLPGAVPLDVRDGPAVQDAVADFQPEVIVHCAGMAQVDYAEVNESECRDVTLNGLAHVIAAAKTCAAKMVFLSSDQVFGESKSAMKADTPTAPLNVYGRTLAQAETLVQEASSAHLIVRTSTVFGRHDLPRNPVLAALKRLREGKGVTAARDRFTQPTYAPDLATAILTLAERDVRGTVHVVGPDRMTESAFLKQVAFVYGLDADLVAAVPAAALCEDAPRPLSPWLDRLPLKALLGNQPIRSLGDALRTMRDVRKVTPLRVAA